MVNHAAAPMQDTHPTGARAPRTSAPPARRGGVLPGILVAAYLALLAWAYSGLYMDDAFIGFRYVANFVAGEGFVFNPGDRVEGVTNIGWLLLLAPFALALPIPLAAKLLGVVLLATTLALLHAALRPLAAALAARSPVFSALPAVTLLVAATQADFAAFTLLGMETPFLAALLAALLLLMRAKPRPLALAALGVLGFLVRPEAILVLPLAVVLALRLGALARREAAWTLAAFAGAAAFVILARWAYFGDVVPNTFHAKPGGALVALANLFTYGAGRSVNVGYPFAGLLALAVMAVGAVTVVRAAPRLGAAACAITATGLLFGLYAAPDWTEMGRYFAPYAPVAAILLCAGLYEIARALARGRIGAARRVVSLLLVGGVALPGVALALARVSDGWRTSYPGYVMTGATLVAPALWMRDNTPATATIATRRIGILAYYGGRRVFDYTYGLIEKDVARLVRREGRVFEDPNDPALADAWRKRAPDYLLEDGPVIDKIASAAGGTRAGFTVHGLTYRVVKTFTIGRDAEWTLAERVGAR